MAAVAAVAGRLLRPSLVHAPRVAAAARAPVGPSLLVRSLAAAAPTASDEHLAKTRNIGISAHIDSGKTTLSERILYYAGRINKIREVRGGDGGATMDSMELERQRGITIQSAATQVQWSKTDSAADDGAGLHTVNLIDTPGHVDFQIEVERALRVLDGAVLVVCAVGGVQSQTITVCRQMNRYSVPRVVFVNKLDRQGANPDRCVKLLRDKLRLHCALVQLHIGAEEKLAGIVDLVEMKAFKFQGEKGQDVSEIPVPDDLAEKAKAMRHSLVETVAEVDDELADLFLAEEDPTAEQLRAAIRRATISLQFIPAFVGSAFKNVGVQLLLNGVIDYLPSPPEVKNEALDQSKGGELFTVPSDPSAPFISLAFKLEDTRYGQLTYIRVYQGTIRKGDTIYNVNANKRVKIPRLVRMNADEMEDIQEASAGDICALFGVECSTGDTFTVDQNTRVTMTAMHVPNPVISLAIKPKNKTANLAKVLNKFRREDPTFVVHTDKESGETIISGMGELHLEIYIERMNREFGIEVEASQPRVAFRESLSQRVPFDYTHRKQSGGAGQYARVTGYVEPIERDPDSDEEPAIEFENSVVGGSIPTNYIPAVEKGFREAMVKGPVVDSPVVGVRVVLEDGNHHPVDSSEMAFKIAAQAAFRSIVEDARPILLEPIMKLSVEVPQEFQGTVVGALNRRKGVIVNTEVDQGFCVIDAHVPLNNMLAYSTELRSMTQGKGEFSMEYSHYAPVPKESQDQISKEYRQKKK